jgi:hypothetical protein
MKKMIFLLLMAFALVGFVSAGDAHPLGNVTLEMADIVMAEYSVNEDVVTQPTVLVTPVTVEPSSIQAMAYDDVAIRPHKGMISLAQETRKKVDQALSAGKCNCYYLRC